MVLMWVLLMMNIPRSEVVKLLPVSPKRVTEFTAYMSEIAVMILENVESAMKNTWQHCEIDESCIGGRKGDTGKRQRLNGSEWMLTCCRMSSEHSPRTVLYTAISMIEGRRKEDVLPMLLHFSTGTPGSTITSDGLGSYSAIGRSVLVDTRHITINHSIGLSTYIGDVRYTSNAVEGAHARVKKRAKDLYSQILTDNLQYGSSRLQLISFKLNFEKKIDLFFVTMRWLCEVNSARILKDPGQQSGDMTKHSLITRLVDLASEAR